MKGYVVGAVLGDIRYEMDFQGNIYAPGVIPDDCYFVVSDQVMTNDTHYFENRQPIERDSVLISHERGVLMGVPAGAQLQIQFTPSHELPPVAEQIESTGEPLQINAPAGKTSIRIEHWPYKPETIEIDIPVESTETPVDAQIVTLNPFDSLEACQAHCKAQIDASAGKARARYITTDPGQAETYAEKERDAQDFIKNEPNFTETELETMHPWVAAAAAARDMSLQNAAVLILGTAGQWRPLGIKIEKLRETVKHQIGQAPDQITACRIMQEGVAGLEAV